MRVSTDDRCRLQSKELFKPNTPYEAEVEPDGSVRLVELPPNADPKARLVRRDGRTVVVSDRMVTAEDVERAMESFP